MWDVERIPTASAERLRVIELGSMAAGQYCGHLLAGLGAAVVRVQIRAAGGHQGPASGEGSNHEQQLRDVYLNANKEILQVEAADYEMAVREIIDRADVVIDSTTPGDDHTPAVRPLYSSNPGLIEVRISWFGSDGPYSAIRGSELTCTALSGYMSINGTADRKPLKLWGLQGEYHAGLHGAIGVLAALRERSLNGRGHVIDVSVQESLALLTAGAPVDFFHTGSIRRRSGNSSAASSRGQTYTSILTCADGYILVAVVGRRGFQRLETVIGEALPVTEDHVRDFPGAHEVELDHLCGAWLAGRKRNDVLEKAVACGLHWALVNDLSDFIASEQVQARQFLTQREWPDRGVVLVPARPVLFSRITWNGDSRPVASAPRPTFKAGER